MVIKTEFRNKIVYSLNIFVKKLKNDYIKYK